jgi:hypothetical protein
MKIKEENVKALKTMPTFKSKDIEWINWYNQIKGRYGRSDSARIFISTWTKRGSKEANTIELRKLVSADGISIDDSVWNKVADLGGGISDSFGNIMKVGKVTAFVVGGILVLGLGMFVLNLAKTPTNLTKGGFRK